MYWICLHHTIRQIFSSCNHCKKSKLFPALPTLLSCSGSQYTEWKLAGNWSAFQQKALCIEPFNLMCWPRNSIITGHFQGDCAWGNSSISCITLTSLNQEKSLSADCRTLQLSPAAAAWTPQIWAPCYLFTYSFEVIFQDYLKPSLNRTSCNSWDLKLTMFLVLFLFVLQITDGYLWKGHALATMEVSLLSESWCQRTEKYFSK